MKRYLLPALLAITVLLSLSAPMAEAVVIQKEVRIDIDFQNSTKFVLRNPNSGAERTYSWAENTTPSDDTWRFDVYIEANASVVCPSNEDLIRRIQDDYTKMLDTCRASQEGWAQAGDLVGKFTECQTALSSCQVVRDDNINILNSKNQEYTTLRPELDACKNSLQQAQNAQQGLQSCNQQVATLSAENQELDKSKTNRGIIGFLIGAAVFFFLNKRSGQQQNMTPPDMRSGF